MTLSAWPTKVYGFPVVKSPIGSAGQLMSPTSIVLHTTEGPEAGDPRPTFAARGDAPHFAVSAKDGGTIWQTRALNEWGAALRHGTIPPGAASPNAHALQIEICGFSDTNPWGPPATIAERVAAVMAYMADFAGVPLQVPNGTWEDDCSDMPLPWAANNSRRRWAAADNWPKVRGVWQHVEVPWQDPTWHYDCGAIRRTALIAVAKALRDGGDDDLTDEQAKMLAETHKAAKDQATVNEQIYRRSGAEPKLPADFDPLTDGWPKGALDRIAQEIVQ